MDDQKWIEQQEANIPKGKVRTRFAPSPTGYMHIGNLRTALYAWLIARHNDGTFILRIEDTDRERFVRGAVDFIYATLEKCGLDHDEGPDVGGPVGPYVQSERRDFYGKYARALVERGHAYYCFCEKTADNESDAHTLDPCRDIPPEEAARRVGAGEPFAVRQKTPTTGVTSFDDLVFGKITVENVELEDQVLLKRDGLPTYNFANVIDDHMMGITHVVRGSEYLSSTPKYNLLYAGFGWTPPQYIHVSAVMRDAYHKMSKRSLDASFADLLYEGYLPEAVLNYVALLGWSPRGELAEREIFSLTELAAAFDIGGISKSPAIFDKEKLTHFNSEYIRAMSPEAFAKAAEPYIRQAVPNPAIDTGAVAVLLQQRTEVLSEIPEKVAFFQTLPDYDPALYIHKKSKTDLAGSLETLRSLRPQLSALPEWSNQALFSSLTDEAVRCGVKNAKVMWPLRIALTGQAVTPGGASEIAAILGREESLRRLDIGIAKLEAAV